MDVRFTPSESGSDFLSAATEVTTTTPSPLDFNNADLTDTISIPIQNDNNAENTDTITVTLVEQEVGAIKAYTLGSPASATATIQDDDVPLLSISAGPQVIEGIDNNATFNVTTNRSPNAVWLRLDIHLIEIS